MDDRFSKVERNMETHQKVAMNMLILSENSIKPWCCHYITNENDQIQDTIVALPLINPITLGEN